jgi:hypothetical protein
MGRRIYENGNFVWKYTFGRQDSNMCDLTFDYGIGKYVSQKYTEKDDDETYTYELNYWIVDKNDITKLKALLKTFSKKTRTQLNKIGMKAVKDFVEKQSDLWKEHFKEDLKELEKAKSEYDFQYNSSCGSGFEFNVYDIFASELEKHLSCSFDFYAMVENFIKYMEKENRTSYKFEDE